MIYLFFYKYSGFAFIGKISKKITRVHQGGFFHRITYSIFKLKLQLYFVVLREKQEQLRNLVIDSFILVVEVTFDKSKSHCKFLKQSA